MFKKIVNELKGIRDCLDSLEEGLRIASEANQKGSAGGVDAERLSALEGRIEVILGQVEAGITKAEALKATARAAEDRERGHAKRAEGYLELAKGIEGSEDGDPFETAGRAYAEAISGGNDDEGPGLSPVPNGVEGRRSGLARVRQAKRGQ